MVIRVFLKNSPNISLLVSNKNNRTSNMKKTYLKPATQTVVVETQQMIALSKGDEYKISDVTYSREDEYEW